MFTVRSLQPEQNPPFRADLIQVTYASAGSAGKAAGLERYDYLEETQHFQLRILDRKPTQP
jgi:hypothetical protein